MASKSKKIQKVIDGIRAWNLSSSSSNPKSEIEEILKSDNFKFGKIVQYGFPSESSCVAYEPAQRLLAIGTKLGTGRLLGCPGVDHVFQQPTGSPIIQIIFLVNQGSFLTICDDGSIHLWNYQTKPAELQRSLQFKRETLTCAYLSPGGFWLYLGTEKGNIFFVNVQKFAISGYVINWNKAIDLSQNHHPGSIVQLEECPTDSNRLLIGFSTGFLSLWNLKEKSARFRFKFNETLWGFCWFPDGKNFITCHSGGYLVTWNSRQSNTPISVIKPHNRDNEMDTVKFEPIKKVILLTTKTNESIMVFSGGTPIQPIGTESTETTVTPLPSLTVMKDKRLTILQMDYPVVDFTQLCEALFSNTTSEPFGIAILLENDLMVIDLLSSNYPSFENPYPIDLHVSPVTCVQYVSDCPAEFVAALYTAKPRGAAASKKQKAGKNGQAEPTNGGTTSSHKWPINGGQSGSLLNSYPELIITGHADGSLRFWDATGTSLTSLYKFRLTTFFERISPHQHVHQQQQQQQQQSQQQSQQSTPTNAGANQCRHVDDCGRPCSQEHLQLNANVVTDGMATVAIEKIQLCTDTKRMMVAGKYYVTMLSFTRREVISDVPVLDTCIVYETAEEAEVMTEEYAYSGSKQATLTHQQSSQSLGGAGSPAGDDKSSVFTAAASESVHTFISVKSGLIKWAPGYQPDVVARLASQSCEPPSQICSIAFNSHFGLMAYGNEQGLAVVDFVQKVCLMSSGTPDLYGSNDPYNRVSWSPGNRREEQRCPALEPQNVAANGCYPPGSTSSTGSTNPSADQGQESANQSAIAGPTGKSASVKNSHMYKSELKRNKSQIETGPFTRSTSSSTSSLDHISCETITTLAFGDTFSRKSDAVPKPCLWVGTSLGSVMVINVHLPDLRNSQPVIVSPSGTIIRLRGSLVSLAFLDSQGDPIPTSGTMPYASSVGTGAPSRLPPSFSYSQDQTSVPAAGSPTPTTAAAPSSSSSTSSKRPVSYISKQATVTGSNSLHGFSTSEASTAASVNAESPAPGESMQFVVLCSEKSAEVVALPAQVEVSRIKITETSSVVRAQILVVSAATASASANASSSSTSLSANRSSGASGPCLVTLLANGHLMAFSLPGLRLLMDQDSVSPGNSAAMTTSSTLGPDDGGLGNAPAGPIMAMAGNGLIIYMSSPSQLEKVTISADFVSNIRAAQGDLFVPKEMPSPPKKGFFEALFNNSPALDRDELFGEATSGKGSTATATLVTGKLDRAHLASAGAQSEIAKARMAALERGEKLSEAELKTQEMMEHAKTFSKTASQLAAKYEKKDKRWGLPF